MNKSFLSFLPLILFALLVTAFVVALHHAGGSKFAQHVGDPVPVTDLPVLGTSDVRFTTQDWKGHVYIVNFFASWCVPCRAEAASLMHLAGTKTPLIGIALKDKPTAVSAFLEKEGNPFVAVAYDDTGRTGIDWGITGVPETFVVDRAGILRFHLVGVLTDEIVDNQIVPLLKRLQ